MAAWWTLTRPLTLPQPIVAFEVKPGMSLSAVARELQAADVVPQSWPMIVLARWRGVDRAIKAGSYEIDTGITLPQLLGRLTQGDATQTSFAIIEGNDICRRPARVARAGSGEEYGSRPSGR